MTDLEFTGERLVPEKSPPDLVSEHFARYEFAKNFVKGLKVIDFGCGVGYGSRMLGSDAENVVGIDISEEAIKQANEKYSSENVEFIVGDVTQTQLGEKDFDAGVCFEVIEHIEIPENLLREAGRIIKESGIFIGSTPNGAVRVSSLKNPFHVKEYTIQEFKALLEGAFPAGKWDIEIHGQFIRGKKYSRMSVALKNFYLGLKGMLGIKPAEKAVGRGSNGESGLLYEFRTEQAELAEYLIAVVKGRK